MPVKKEEFVNSGGPRPAGARFFSPKTAPGIDFRRARW